MKNPSPIQINTDFATANARVLDIKNDGGMPEVHFTPLPKGSPVAIWFCFDIIPDQAYRGKVKCVLHFFDNLLGGRSNNAKGLLPVFRTEQANWARVEHVTHRFTEDNRPLVSWTVPADQGTVRVALSYPYGKKELQNLADDISGAFKSAEIGVTPLGNIIRRFYNLTIPEKGGEPAGVYCLARQHASEAPGSWVLDGFLRRMADAGDAAPMVWAVPFTDTDGVLNGRPGKDSFPWDFNRAWGTKLFPRGLQSEMGSHPMRYEIKCIQNDICRWMDMCRPQIVLDFHAPCIADSPGIYCYLRDIDQEGRPDNIHAPWVRVFSDALDPAMRAKKFYKSGRYPSRWNSARVGDFVNQALKLPEVTFETPYACSHSIVFDRYSYRSAGAALAEAVMSRIEEDF